MNISIMKVITLILLITNVSISQSGALDIYNTSHFARAIRLGNAYTGVAEGPEAIFYNVAGIANQNSYSLIFSKGQGLGIFAEEPRAYDYALIVPFLKEYGTLGLSANTFSYEFVGSKSKNNIYSINFARKMLDDLSIGISLNYYSVKMSNVSISSLPNKLTSVSGSSFDINLSSLYKLPENVKFSENDSFQIGFQIKNILNTKVKYDNISQDDYKFQNIRLGFSYSYIPNLQSFFELSPLEFMLAFDAVFTGADYEFPEWQPNYGIELTLLEVIQLSFGRENEIQIKETYSYTPQYPVNRYGFGIKIPFQKLLDLTSKLELKFDYSISDWQKIDEEGGRSEFIAIRRSIDNKAISASLNIGL